MNYEKLSPALAALMFEYFRFPESLLAAAARPQMLSISAAGLPETKIFITCGADATLENAAGVRVDSQKGGVRTAHVELGKISDLSERTDVQYLSGAMRFKSLNDFEAIEEGLHEFVENEFPAADSESKTHITKTIAANKFAPVRFNFVVPSNNQPNSPAEVVLRGWFEASGDCEISIMSPNGGVTKSTQSAVVEGNPTRFGNYTSSQAFLTKPKIAGNGKREFFIDLRPIAPKEFVIGGVWKLTVTNIGKAEAAVGVLLQTPENAEDAKFV